MKIPDLNNWEPSESDAKDVQNTKMLDTIATEPADTQKSSPGNNFKDHTVSHGPFGKLGTKGRG